MLGQGGLLVPDFDGGVLGGGLTDTTEPRFSSQPSSRIFEDAKSDVDKAEEEISSGHYPTSNGTRKGGGMELGRKTSSNDQQHHKEASGVDELRELTSRGVCAPFWRTTQQTGPGQPEQSPHLLQTCWVRYQTEETARRTSMWHLSESGSALSPYPTSRSSSLSTQQPPQIVRELLTAYNGSLGPNDAMEVQRSLSGLSNMSGRAGQVLSGRSASLMSMPGDPLAPMGMPLEHRSNTMGVSVGLGAAGNMLVPLAQRSTSMFGSLSGNGMRSIPQGWGVQYGGPETPEMYDRILTSISANGGNNGILQALFTGTPQEGGTPRAPPRQIAQELERQKMAQQKWDGERFSPNGAWPHDAQARNFVQNGLTFPPMRLQDAYGGSYNELCGLDGASRSLDPRESVPIAPRTPYYPYQQPSPGISDSIGLQEGVRATSLNDLMDPSSGRLLTQLPERVMMALTAAPSMFAVPTCINKGFNPPFVIKVAVVSAVPTQIKATVAAYVVQKDTVANLEAWLPANHVVTESLSGAVVTQTIVCNGPHKQIQDHAPGKHQGVGEFVFQDLKFHSSSRMKPRWLLFALTLPTDDVIFCQYTVPTIVMSRQCDQQSKALLILRGQAVSKKGRGKSEGNLVEPMGEEGCGEWPTLPPFNKRRWRDLVESNCKHFALIRPFDAADLKMLARVAGFDGCNNDEVSSEQWMQFGNWFLSYLRLFRCHQALWTAVSPCKAICGFGVDRTEAERLLDGRPEGTFLVRPSMSLAGTMVISAVTGGRIKHMALDGNQLDSRSLEVWVRDVCEATHVLNAETNELVPKEKVFLLNYSRIGVSTDLAMGQGQMFSSSFPMLPLPSMPSHRASMGSPYLGGRGSGAFPQESSLGMSAVCGHPVTTGMGQGMPMSGSPRSNMSEGV